MVLRDILDTRTTLEARRITDEEKIKFLAGCAYAVLL